MRRDLLQWILFKKNSNLTVTGLLTILTQKNLFLLYFGLFLNIITLYGNQALGKTPDLIKLLVGISALILILGAIYFDLARGTDINVRRFKRCPLSIPLKKVMLFQVSIFSL